VRDVLGDFGELSAQFVSRFDVVKLTDTGEIRPKTAPDQIMVHGTLASGAAISVHYRGGMSRGTNLLWEINGTQGDIQVTGASGHAQMVQLSIRGASGGAKDLAPLMPPASAYAGWPDTSVSRNVARMYARVADDIRNGTRNAPTFSDAVTLHEIIDMIERSAERSS
jgi:predicted dehydrogenase